MFTGLIEDVGQLAEIKVMPSGYRVRVDTSLAEAMSAGDSLAVNGVCLTVISADATGVHADVGAETARITSLGGLKLGALVNLERPLRADARLGGHFVQGHVDATGTIDDIREEGASFWVTVKYPSAMAGLLVRKGSVAVDGVSLTVAGLDASHFDVQVIPFTWTHTTFHRVRPGDVVNLEFDILGKYVARAIETASR